MESEKALSYSKGLVTKWLRKRCLIGDGADSKAETIAAYFNAEPSTKHGQVYVHGQRIGTEKLAELGIDIEYLENDQSLQDDVLTTYHLMTLIFETGPSVKFIASDKGKMWAKEQLQRQVSDSEQEPVE